MKDLLFLAHRVPYPPNKGDKIRSFNFLKHLTRDYRIFLGAFIDDPDDWRHVPALQEFCHETCLVEIAPFKRKLQSLTGLLRGTALSLPYYSHPDMHDWVARVLHQHRIEQVFMYSSPMAQYVQGDDYQYLHRVIDFVDVDSEKWRQYSHRHAWPMSWLYDREGRRLLDFERKIAVEFDASVFVTKEEAELFCQLAPETGHRVTHINNGVDTDYFSPQTEFDNPYPPAAKVLVFTGAMDYWANEDAVKWFCQSVFPLIRQEIAEARFYIVGARPSTAVRKLDGLAGVHVTGAVKDIRPYMAHASMATAPMRIARGLQNKVLEAMAMGRPVLATRAAMEGIDAGTEFYRLVSDEAGALAHKAVGLLRHGDQEDLGRHGRELVQKNFSWAHNLRRVETLLQESIGQRSLLQVGNFKDNALGKDLRKGMAS